MLAVFVLQKSAHVISRYGGGQQASLKGPQSSVFETMDAEKPGQQYRKCSLPCVAGPAQSTLGAFVASGPNLLVRCFIM